MPAGIVLADAAYGDETGFRESLTELGLLYAVGIRSMTTVWPQGVSPTQVPALPRNIHLREKSHFPDARRCGLLLLIRLTATTTLDTRVGIGFGSTRAALHSEHDARRESTQAHQWMEWLSCGCERPFRPALTPRPDRWPALPNLSLRFQ